MGIILIIIIAIYVSISYSKSFNEEEEEIKDDKHFRNHISTTPFDRFTVYEDGSSEIRYHNGDVKTVDKYGNAKIVDKDGNKKGVEYVKICINERKSKISIAKIEDTKTNNKNN